MTTVWEYTVGEAFWTMLWFFMFFIWIWLLITVFADIFRSDDLSGWGKALWTVFCVFLPYLGGKKMGEHAVQDAQRQDDQMRAYVQSVAGGSSAAGEIERLHQLKENGAITDEEFQQAKAKLLS